MTPRTALYLRLATFHASLSTVSGVQTPLWPLFLAYKGLGPVQIGLILSAAYLVKFVSNPMAGYASDMLGDRKLPIVALAAIALATFIPFSVAQGFVPLLILTLLAMGAYTAITPLGDSLTFFAIADQRLTYGGVRVWGSIGFVACSFLASWLLIDQPRPLILWTIVGGLVVIVAACWRLPELRGERTAGRPAPIGPLLTNPVFLLFLGAAMLNMSSQSMLYAFGTLHWKENGLSGGAIGFLWAEMVTAESLFFLFGHRLVGWFGPARLLMLGGVGGILRWIVTGLTVDPWLLASVQWMHCLTFTATHLAAMYFIQRSVPRELSARAQAIYSAVCTGLNFGIATPLVGVLYERIGGGDAFLCMAVLSAGGLGFGLLMAARWRGGSIMAAPVPAGVLMSAQRK